MTRVLAALIITTTAFSARAENVLDFFTGPVVGSGAVVAMGGAFIGLGEGADGHLFQPAALTTRSCQNRRAPWDFELASGSLSQINKGAATADQAGIIGRRFSQGGFNLKYRLHGYGAHLVQSDFVLKISGGKDAKEALIRQRIVGLGIGQTRRFGSLHWGLIATLTTVSLNKHQPWIDVQNTNDVRSSMFTAGRTLVSIDGTGLIGGVLWTPVEQPYRIGAKLRTPLVTEQTTGRLDPDDPSFMPDAINVPWQIGLGASYQFGPRPFNEQPKTNAPDQLSPAERRHLLFAVDLILTGATPHGLDTVSYLLDEREVSGQLPSMSLRAGAESEIIPNRLIVRGGSYYEPCRRSRCPGKWHATGGMDLRFRAHWDLRFGVAVDVAKRYQNAGISLGIWY